jgi:transposase InsO family protein
VTSLCRRYAVTPAGFYAWRRRAESAHAEQDRRLTGEVARLFAAHHERYGSPRIHHLLHAAGWVVSRRRVARLMHAAGLRAKAVRGYRSKAKTLRLYARHPDRLRGLVATRPNQVWVGDITYLRAADGWRYLAVVMDQGSRRILAWSLTRRRSAAVTCAVLARAARGRPARGVIFHSDRGSEYMGEPFGELVARLGLRQSASARGPEDNAHAESFFHSLKAELIRGTDFASEHQLRAALRSYIRYYNTIRLHSSLQYTAPLVFEQRTA